MPDSNRTSSHPEPVRRRPRLPAAYGIASGDDGMLPWSYVNEQMATSRNYWVSTTQPDGRPHVVPVWGLWLDDTFWFCTDFASRKGRNLAASSQIAVHLESGDNVVILEGTAEVVTDALLLARFVDAYEAKYDIRPDVSNPAYGVYRLQARTVFAWQERDFPNSATRWHG